MDLTQDENLILQSYLNCLLITSLKNNNFFDSEYFKNLNLGNESIKQSLKHIGIDNQGMMLTFLYSMLVLPSEKILEDYSDEFEKIKKFIDTKKDDATNSNYKKDSNGIDYIRHIRNAVAHGRVKFQPNLYVEFHDENKYTGETCYIRIPLKNFGSILEEIKNIFEKYIYDIQKRIEEEKK